MRSLAGLRSRRFHPAGLFAQKGLHRLQIGAEHLDDREVHLRIPVQDFQERVARKERKVAFFQAGDVNLRNFAAHDRAKTKDFSGSSRSQ